MTDGLEGLCRTIAASFYTRSADSEDLLQEARIGAWEAELAYDGSIPFSSFAAICIRRKLVSSIIRANRNRHRLLTDALRFEAPGGGALAPDPRQDPHAQLVAKLETRQALAWCANRLTPIERDAVVGSAVGLRYDEIGDFGAVGNAAWRGRAKLSYERRLATA